MKHLSTVIFCLLAFSTVALSREWAFRKNTAGLNPYIIKANTLPQDSLKESDTVDYGNLDWSSLGVGWGYDFGGLGGTYLAYVSKNIGVFASLGWANAGMGYGGGLKIRFPLDKPGSKLTPFAIAMYGYNGSITVQTDNNYDNLFFGATAGIGTDFKAKPESKGFWSLALLVPFRDNHTVDGYKAYLTNDAKLDFKSQLGTVVFSIGYHFIIPIKR
jgi:hypothetical protein